MVSESPSACDNLKISMSLYEFNGKTFLANQPNSKPLLWSVRSYVEDVGGENKSLTLGESWERYPSRFGIHKRCRLHAGRKAGSDTHLAPGFTNVADSTPVGNLGAIPVSLRDSLTLQISRW